VADSAIDVHKYKRLQASIKYPFGVIGIDRTVLAPKQLVIYLIITP